MYIGANNIELYINCFCKYTCKCFCKYTCKCLCKYSCAQ